MRMTEAEYQALLDRRRENKEPIPVDPLPQSRNLSPKGPNKTELEYKYRLQLEYGVEPKFEALTVKFANGHKYTPDWVVFVEEQVICFEVKARGKNGYRQPSYQRAKLAFDQARTEFPSITWRWVEKHNGEWNL